MLSEEEQSRRILLAGCSVAPFASFLTLNCIFAWAGGRVLPKAYLNLARELVKTVTDSDSYGSLIAELCELKMIDAIAEMVREMAVTVGLNPRQEILVKVLGAMRANKEIWRAVKAIEMLETKGVYLGFECFELVLEGCIECRKFVLAGKFAMDMAKKGFIPYIKVTQKVVEGLAEVGDWELGNAVRQRFAELKS